MGRRGESTKDLKRDQKGERREVAGEVEAAGEKREKGVGRNKKQKKETNSERKGQSVIMVQGVRPKRGCWKKKGL